MIYEPALYASVMVDMDIAEKHEHPSELRKAAQSTVLYILISIGDLCKVHVILLGPFMSLFAD